MSNSENLSLWGYYVKCWKNYVNFEGRARRKEYWGFYLFNLLIAMGIGIVEGLTSAFWQVLITILGLPVSELVVIFLTSILSTLYGLAIFLPGLAVQVRRLHDIGKSGWWVLILFAPILIGITAAILVPLLANFSVYSITFAVLVAASAIIVPVIVMLVWLVKDSDSGENEYGPNPKI
ncbi:MAG: DUF805 domain-containing protein [Fibromonadaceae bacterium]|jgi:uncharacterized membrane protein YhaH (DUF805 family)|nr:DUF805 domain-containing protein [Fibromonadaceae bacterium]